MNNTDILYFSIISPSLSMHKNYIHILSCPVHLQVWINLEHSFHTSSEILLTFIWCINIKAVTLEGRIMRSDYML